MLVPSRLQRSDGALADRPWLVHLVSEHGCCSKDTQSYLFRESSRCTNWGVAVDSRTLMFMERLRAFPSPRVPLETGDGEPRTWTLTGQRRHRRCPCSQE